MNRIDRWLEILEDDRVPFLPALGAYIGVFTVFLGGVLGVVASLSALWWLLTH